VTDGLLAIVPESIGQARFDSGLPLIGGWVMLRPIIGIVLAVLVGIVVIGGIRRIATVASRIVPLMCAIYVFCSVTILVMNFAEVPSAFSQIFRYAFQPLAVGGGFFGFVLARTVERGVARGVFSNESGLGSAPMAYAAAKTHEMARAGFVAMLGPFIDTIVVCSMTALVIIISGLWQVKAPDGTVLYGPGAPGQPKKVLVNDEHVEVAAPVGEEGEPYQKDDGTPYVIPTGASLTSDAFEHCLPGVGRGPLLRISPGSEGNLAVQVLLLLCHYCRGGRGAGHCLDCCRQPECPDGRAQSDRLVAPGGERLKRKERLRQTHEGCEPTLALYLFLRSRAG
jgi:hypothetical protein